MFSAHLRNCAEGTLEPSGRTTKTMTFQPQFLVFTVSDLKILAFHLLHWISNKKTSECTKLEHSYSTKMCQSLLGTRARVL